MCLDIDIDVLSRSFWPDFQIFMQLQSNHKVESRSPLAPSSKSIKDGESEKKPKRTMARRKRKEREQYSPEPSNVVKTKVSSN